MANEIAIKDPGKKRKVEPYEHRIRYHELDVQGMVHPSNYINWMENARMNLMEQIGLGYKQMKDMEIAVPMISFSVEYRSPIKFEEVIVVDTKLISYDGYQMEVAYRIFNKKTGEDHAVAKSKHHFMNKSGLPISLKRVYPELDTTFFEMK